MKCRAITLLATGALALAAVGCGSASTSTKPQTSSTPTETVTETVTTESRTSTDSTASTTSTDSTPEATTNTRTNGHSAAYKQHRDYCQAAAKRNAPPSASSAEQEAFKTALYDSCMKYAPKH